MTPFFPLYVLGVSQRSTFPHSSSTLIRDFMINGNFLSLSKHCVLTVGAEMMTLLEGSCSTDAKETESVG